MRRYTASKSKATLATLISSIILMVVGFSVLALNDAASDLLSESYLLQPDAIGIWFLLAFVLLVAPIFEETFFRLWLKPKYLWAVFFMVASLALSVGNLPLGIGLTLCTIPVFIYYRRSQKWLEKYPISAVIISGLFFSFAHGANFSELYFAHLWYFLILLGLGMILGLTRLRFGLGAAIACHFLYNLFVTLPVLPVMQNQTYELQHSTLIEHGLFENRNKEAPFEKQICRRCNERNLIFRVAYKAFPEALVKLDLRRNEKPFDKFSLKAKEEKGHTEILNDLSHHFSLRIEKKVEEIDVVKLEFFEIPDYAYSLENLVKFRPKSPGDFTSSSAAYFIQYIENEYGIKVQCDAGCDAMGVLAISGKLSLEENLQRLSNKGLIEFSTDKRNFEVVTISKAE